MKRVLGVLLALLCVAGAMSLFACSSDKDSGKTVDLSGLVNGFVSSYSLTGGKVYEKNSAPLDEMQIFDLYYKDGKAADFSKVEEYVVYLDTSDNASDTEIGVFRLAKDADATEFLSYLRARRDNLLAENERYPFDTGALDEAKFGSVGQYVYYVILRGHSAETESAIKAALK